MFLQNGIGSERLEKSWIFLLTLFAFCLPLHQKWSTVLILALAALSLFIKKDKTIFWKWSFLLPPLLYLFIVLSLLYSEQMEFRYLEQRASLVAFPIIFSGSRIQQKDLLKIFESFVWGCAIAVLICYCYAFYNSISLVNGELVFKPVLNDDFSFMYSVVRDGNYFFSTLFSLFHQTTYFAMYLNTAIAIILAFSFWKKRKIHFFLLVLFPTVLFQLSGKIGLITCGLIFMTYGLFRIKNKLHKLLFALLIVSIGTVFVMKNPRGKIMAENLLEKGLTIDSTQRYGYSLRLMSWDAATTIIARNPIFGVGIGDTQKELNSVYADKGYAQPLKESLNAHNQFLQLFLVAGIFGLMLILAILWNLYRSGYACANENVRFFNMLFSMLIILSFLFESVLNRYSGISFFFFLYYLVITLNEKKRINGN